MYKSDSSFYIFQINCSKPTFQYKKKKKKTEKRGFVVDNDPWAWVGKPL